MKKYHSFGKGVMTALLVTMLVGATLGCAEDSPEDEPVLQSIVVTSLPTKVVYTVGEALNLSGIEVTGMYPGGKSKVETVNLSNISGYDKDKTGQQTVTVTVGGKTATFTVVVTTGATGGDATLQSIMVTHLPTKTAYTQGETLSLIGLVVTGIYANGTTKAESVTLSNISGYNANTVGQQTVTVTVSGKTATFTVTVTASLAPPAPLAGLDGLASAPGGNTADNPVPLTLSGSLANEGWATVLSAIAAADKYVSLDLSACAMAGTEFDPGDGAGVDKITALILPDTVNRIKAGTGPTMSTFGWFTALRSLSGVGVKTIGDYAFSGCTSLTEVSLPAAQTIGEVAFYDTSLTEVSLPAATDIGDWAFYECGSLTTVSLPAATTIGDWAFWHCTSLASVSLPAATSIGGGTFYGCTSLTTVSLPLVTIINDGLQSSSGGTYSYYGTFSSCTSLTAVDLPMATTIGNYAFRSCTSLTTMSLPAATSIGEYAFTGCTSLTEVSLPAATTIGDGAFASYLYTDSSKRPYRVSGCRSLTTVYLPATPPSIGYYGIFEGTGLNSSGTITVSVPAGTVSAYTSKWGVSASTAANGNTNKYGSNHKAVFIRDAALPTELDGLANTPGGNTADNPVSLTLSVDLANGGWEAILVVISAAGKYVSLDLSACTMDGTQFAPGTYAGANRVTALVLPDAAKSIPAGTSSNATFRAFTVLASLSGAGVETIGASTFYDCTSLTSVSLPAATTIGGGTFSNSAAFGGCTSLTSVSLPVATDIGDYAFWGCTSLTSVSLPAATTIGDDAFHGCTSLTSVSLPAAESINFATFSGCTSLASVSLPAATTIGSGAFRACTSLTSVSLPAATTIDDEAFYGCTSLTTVSLPAATSIGYHAFTGCTSLTSVSLPATPPAIISSWGYGYGIFSETGSSGTITVNVPAGVVSAYTSKWYVNADTPAGGNTSVYGSNHKAVLITDAAQ
jgi:hypothetical protein